MSRHETGRTPPEKGFWFLLSIYIGVAAAAYVVFVLLLRVDAETCVAWLMTSLFISIPIVLLLRWWWRRRHPRAEDTDERERMIRGWARQVAGCTLLAAICLACIVGMEVADRYGLETVNVKVEWLGTVMIGALGVWELGREVALEIAHRGERRRGKE